MSSSALPSLKKEVFTFRWNPNRDLAVVALSWILVVAALSMSTFVIGQETLGGMGYFFMYAIIGATLCGVGIPLYWMVVVKKRPLSDLGLTFRNWKLSLVIQIALTLLVNVPRMLQLNIPPFQQFFPLLCMALAIGFFEAVFWRGWVQLRLEEAFGIIPSIVIASALYAVYHIGYGMSTSEMVFLFFIGLMFAATFRITKSILVLWPLFQPGGQLITLVSTGLSLPFMAFFGFVDALALMLFLVWWANKYYKAHNGKLPADAAAQGRPA
jgi:membrane protease YdiL (CAAX protease family)